jgi:hypothetical protein
MQSWHSFVPMSLPLPHPRPKDWQTFLRCPSPSSRHRTHCYRPLQSALSKASPLEYRLAQWLALRRTERQEGPRTESSSSSSFSSCDEGHCFRTIQPARLLYWQLASSLWHWVSQGSLQMNPAPGPSGSCFEPSETEQVQLWQQQEVEGQQAPKRGA